MIVREFLHKGHKVRECRYDRPIPGIPARYFTAPADRLSEYGTGRTAAQAVADKLAKCGRLAA